MIAGMENESNLSMSPREYQLEMLRLAKKENVIVKLDTGTGKTFIASMLIKHMLPTTNGTLSEGGKRIVFLVKTVQLVVQQAQAIRQHSFLDKEVGIYHGQLKPPVDFWTKDKWKEEFEKHRVLVFSACVFKDILNHGKFSLDKVSLLIFDECHHTAKEDDYAQIAKHFNDYSEDQLPKILGLTASVINGQIKGNLKEHIRNLERKMHSRLVTTANHSAKLLNKCVIEKTIDYSEENPVDWSGFSSCLESPLEIISAFLRKRKADKQCENDQILYIKRSALESESDNGDTEMESDRDFDMESETNSEIGSDRDGEMESETNSEIGSDKDEIESESDNGDIEIESDRDGEIESQSNSEIEREDFSEMENDSDGEIESNVEESSDNSTSDVLEICPFEKENIGLSSKDNSNKVLVNERYYNLLMGEEDNPVKKTKRALSDCISILNDLGPWCALKVAEEAVEDLESCQQRTQLVGDVEEDMINLGICAIKEFISVLNENKVGTVFSLKWISMRVMILVNLLKNLYKKESSTTSRHGVIFVKERQTAFALAKVLNENLKIQLGCHLNLRAGFVTGHGVGHLQHKKIRMDIDNQTKVLEEFRRGDINVLVATRVVEEGMDVRACNLVIKFTEPEDYRSYVQSKGRARMAESRYYVFCSKARRFQVDQKLMGFRRTAEELDDVLLNRAVDRYWNDSENTNYKNDEDLSEYDFRPQGQRGPRVTLNSAMSLLNRYTSSLRHDCPTNPKLHIYISKHKTKEGLKRGNLYLPMPCPVREKIVGKFVSNIKLARQFVALEACKRLYEFNELGMDLFPKPPIISEEAEVPVEKDSKGNILPKTGSRKRRRRYPLGVAWEFGLWRRRSRRTRYLENQIELYPIGNEKYWRENETYTMNLCYFSLSDETAPLKLGFITTDSLGSSLNDQPDRECIARFPLFLPDGNTKSGSIYTGGSLSLSLDQIRTIKNFHCIAMSALVDDLEKLVFDISESRFQGLCLLLQFSSCDFEVLEPDFEKMKEIKETKEVDFMDLPKTHQRGALLHTTHRGTLHKREVWTVDEVVYSKNPNSSFPDQGKASTFAEYYFNEYNVKVQDLEQPLLRVSRVRRLADRIMCPEHTAFPRTPGYTVYLIPEFCKRLPLSSEVWHLVNLLPTFLTRLNHLLLLKNLSVNMFNRSDSRIGEEINDTPGYDKKKAIELYDRNLKALTEATTSAHYGDFTNFERLEVMGDSFLKYAVSVTLHAHANGIREQEGHLTQKRTKLISNANLFNLGQDFIPQYLKHQRFAVSTGFIPPSFVDPNQTDDTSQADTDRWFVEIPDKTIADCMESLIGYSVMYETEAETFAYLDCLKLNPGFVKSGETFTFPPIPEPLLDTGLRRIHLIDKMYTGFEKIELQLGYRFKRREFLLQALTHASCIEHGFTECYQKLEYLGDAVLDYLITQQLFKDKSCFDPGKLTDIRSALVNNRTFAALAVKLKLHLHLKYTDAKLFQLIPQFANSLDKIDEEYLFGTCDQKITVKILGDLFESVAGAVFLDSGRDLKTVRRVFCRRIMKDLIKKYSEDTPINPIRKLYEKYPDFKFSAPLVDKETGLVSVTGEGKCGTFTAQNRNKDMCKFDIANHFLRI